MDLIFKLIQCIIEFFSLFEHNKKKNYDYDTCHVEFNLINKADFK